VKDLENLTDKHGVEFAVVYKLGPGPNGAGGTYYLHSGTVGRVAVPIEADNILIYHTHPGGARTPSDGDLAVLQAYIDAGSPMRSSKIISSGSGGATVNQFTTDGYDPYPGGRTFVMGQPGNERRYPNQWRN
jgi:hypothetical protein